MMPELHPGMKEFNRIFKECNHIYHDIALKLGLSDSGFDILYTLCEIGDGCLQKDICDATMLSRPSTLLSRSLRETVISPCSPARDGICIFT